jgi:DNA-binding NtrC family response regulator
MNECVCLVVDDEPAIRAYLKSILQRKNVRALEASDAVEALRVLQKHGNGIDLIITDIQMPGDMDGVDLAYSVKRSHPAIPVLLISGNVNNGSAGRFTFVQKPFLPETILETIDGLLRPAKLRAAGST